MLNYEKMKIGFRELKIDVSESQLLKINDFYKLYLEWNSIIDLSAITDPDDFMIKHVLDSVSALPYFREKDKTADLGSGGGFPGIVLKILKPSLNLTLIDVIHKKINFLKDVNEKLGLNLQIINASKEKIPSDFDIVTCRAFGSLKKIYDQTKKILKPSGKVLAYKGKKEKILEEKKDFPRRIEIIPLKVPFLEAERNLVVFFKKS